MMLWLILGLSAGTIFGWMLCARLAKPECRCYPRASHEIATQVDDLRGEGKSYREIAEVLDARRVATRNVR